MDSAPAPALAWHWVIETVADLKKVDTSLLKALITRVPNFWTEAPVPVRERIALRYLEELVPSGGGEGTLPSSSEGGIDVGLSSEEVLRHHWRKVATLGNLEKDKAKALTCDLRQFVMRKKVTLPKSSIELLKESIIEGCRERISSLGEDNGLARSDQVGNPCGDIGEDHMRVKRFKVSTDDGNFQSLGQISAHVASDSGNHVVLHGNDGPGRHLHEQNVSNADREDHVHKDIVGGSGNDIQLLKQSSYSQTPSNHAQHLPSSVTKKDASPPIINKGNHDGEPNVVPETPSDDNGCCDVSPNIVPNVDILAKKQQLLSSQILNDDSVIGEWTEERLCMKCVKGGQLLNCSSSGCSVSVHERCLGPVVNVEETGLFYCPFCSYTRACNAYHKAKKKFSRARLALSSFIGKDLAGGIQKNLPPARVLGEVSQEESIRERDNDSNLHSNHYEKDSTTAKEQVKQPEFTNMLDKANTSTGNTEILQNEMRYHIPQSAEGGNNDKDITKAQHCEQPDANDALDKGNLPCNDMGSPSCDISDVNIINRQNETGNRSVDVGVREPQELPDDDSFPCNKDTSQLEDVCDVAKAKEKDESLHKDKSKTQEHKKAVIDHNTIMSSDRDAPTSRTSERRAKRRWQDAEIEKTRQMEGTVENQNREKSSSVKRRKHQTRYKRYSNPIIPHARRTKLPWSSEEEEALKIAVRKFAVNSDGIYPWTKILEFGQHVFHKTRQPGDLKDKWRNIRIKEGLNTT